MMEGKYDLTSGEEGNNLIFEGHGGPSTVPGVVQSWLELLPCDTFSSNGGRLIIYSKKLSFP